MLKIYCSYSELSTFKMSHIFGPTIRDTKWASWPNLIPKDILFIHGIFNK